jgi:dihydrofolate synthase / folylpolyglutamate synthase
VEVGLGGRLDSTNIITPLVSLITNISLDHQHILGEDLPTIAGEKAGIIKRQVPVVISKTQPEIAAVFRQKAQEEKAPIYFADLELEVTLTHQELDHQFFNISRKGETLFSDLELALGGHYQQYNLPGVLKTVELLQEKGYNIPETALRNGLAHVNQLTGFKGRWQIVNKLPLTICDTGHNVDGIKQIVKQLQVLNRPVVHFIFGVVNDKDVTGILELLPPNFKYYYCQAHLPRALPAADLALKAADFGLVGTTYPDVNAAYEAARQAAGPEDIIFIGGSTFVVAEFAGL